MLYGCETWSLTLREERRLRVLATGSWCEYLSTRKFRMGDGGLHNEELYSLYRSFNVRKQIELNNLKWGGNVARMGESRNFVNILMIIYRRRYIIFLNHYFMSLFLSNNRWCMETYFKYCHIKNFGQDLQRLCVNCLIGAIVN